MAKSTAMANALLKLIYNATAWANVADNAASSPLTNIYVAAHSADPGVAGNQTTSEIVYTGYARQAVARTTGGWTVTNNVVQPVAAITFPQSSSGTPVITHVSTGSAVSGAGVRFHAGPVTPNVTVSVSTTQVIANATTITET